MSGETKKYDLALAHYLWPPHWVGELPYWEETGPQPRPDPSILSEVVATADLPGDLRVRAFRDGMIAFHFGPSSPSFFDPLSPTEIGGFIAWQDRAVRLANAHLACLMTALPVPLLGPSGIPSLWSLMQVDFSTGKFKAASDYTSGGTRLSLHLARSAATSFDWRFYRGRIVTAEQMEESFELLRALRHRPSQDMTLLRAELLFRATSGVAHRDWAGGLTSAWGVMEGLLGDLFARHLDDVTQMDVGRDDSGNDLKFMPGKRREFLEGSSMTTRHTVEILSLLGVLPFDLYRASRRCATARNDWLHKQVEPPSDVAHMALKASGELFDLVEGVPLNGALNST